MSGGSYNYLCYKDLGEIAASGMSDLREMRDRLQGVAPESPVHVDTEAVLANIAVLEAQIKALSEAWKAVEWCDSCDWSHADMMAEIETYNREHAEEPAP
jgi:hypothetical protein